MPPPSSEIREWRKRHGLTQKQAGELVLATRRTWQDWELGKRRMHPGLWKLAQISRAS